MNRLDGQLPILIKDIIPGTQGSISFFAPEAFTLDSLYFFHADDGINGPELWVTDGSESGTKLLKNINPSTSSNDQKHLVNFNHVAYFFGIDNINQSASIWRTDGTTNGTNIFFDNCTVSSQSPLVYGVFGDKMLFSGATNGLNELWITDGTIDNTMLFKQLNTNGGDSKPGNFVQFKDLIYFTAEKNSFNRELWRTNGTPEETDVFIDLNGVTTESSEPRFVDVIGDYLYFTAIAADSIGRELWRTDGTVAGTTLVKDINPGIANSIDSYVDIFTVLGNSLLFVADDGIHGKEWWITNAETNNTYLLKDIVDGAPGSKIGGVMLETDSFALFMANDGVHGLELWRTDGTSDGTYMVKDIKTGTGNGIYTINVANYHNKIYFSARDATYGEEVWVSDGTEIGTQRLTNMVYNLGEPTIENMKVIYNYLYFTAPSNQTGYEVWKLQIDGISSTNASVTFPEVSFEVFPNPALNNFKISGNLPAPSALNITLTDMQGRVLSTQHYEQISGAFIRNFETAGIPTGLYLLTLQTETGIQTIPVSIIGN